MNDTPQGDGNNLGGIFVSKVMSYKNEWYSARRRKPFKFKMFYNSKKDVLIRMNDTPQGDGNPINSAF